MKEPKSKTNPPTLSFSAPKPEGEIDNPPNPNPEPDSLVNENPPEEYVTDPNAEPPPEMTALEALQEQLIKTEQLLGVTRQKNIELTSKLDQVAKQKSNYSDVSRKFRIFLNLLQGFAARGMFDQSELAKKPGSEHNLMRHAAGLAEVANKATENRF